MNFSYELIEKYKEYKGYTQDKQVVSDLESMTKGSLSDIKKSKRHLTANQCIFMCKEMGIDFKSRPINSPKQSRYKTNQYLCLWEDENRAITNSCPPAHTNIDSVCE